MCVWEGRNVMCCVFTENWRKIEKERKKERKKRKKERQKYCPQKSMIIPTHTVTNNAGTNTCSQDPFKTSGI